MSVNKVILIGNLGDDIKIKTFDNGGKIAMFPLATSESYKKKDTGEKITKTTWHNIVCKNPTVADILAKYLSKGDKIYIEGSIDNREYTDKDNIKRYITEVVMFNFDFINTKGSVGSATSTPAAATPAVEEEDDLPF